MNKIVWISGLSIVSTVLIFVSANASPSPTYADFDQSVETSHFKIYWRSSETTPADVEPVKHFAEDGFQRVSMYLGQSNSPRQLTLFLEGEAFEKATGNFRYPSADDQGAIHLYRFPGEARPYSEGMPHELVHAFRTTVWEAKRGQDYLKGFGFIEEGFAEFVASTVDPSSKSFVRYGFPLEVVVGYWLESQNDIPLEVLFDHHEINPACVAQAYPLRASFYRYLDLTYGKQKIFELAYYEKLVSKDTFPIIFGRTFSELAVAWKDYAKESYKKLPNSDQLRIAYGEQTPVSHFPVCKQGKNW